MSIKLSNKVTIPFHFKEQRVLNSENRFIVSPVKNICKRLVVVRLYSDILDTGKNELVLIPRETLRVCHVVPKGRESSRNNSDYSQGTCDLIQEPFLWQLLLR